MENKIKNNSSESTQMSNDAPSSGRKFTKNFPQLQFLRMSLIYKAIAGTLVTVCLLQSPAFAMGSGNKYQDAQTGVSYQIFQPGYTGGLLLRSFNLQSCGMGNEQWLASIYGEDRSVQFLETDAKIKCSNPGLGVKVASANINGNKASIVAFCDPANKKQWKSCKTSNIQNYGGYAMWKVPATKSLHATEIEVLVSGLTYAELLKIARGMKPVTK